MSHLALADLLGATKKRPAAARRPVVRMTTKQIAKELAKAYSGTPGMTSTSTASAKRIARLTTALKKRTALDSGTTTTTGGTTTTDEQAAAAAAAAAAATAQQQAAAQAAQQQYAAWLAQQNAAAAATGGGAAAAGSGTPAGITFSEGESGQDEAFLGPSGGSGIDPATGLPVDPNAPKVATAGLSGKTGLIIAGIAVAWWLLSRKKGKAGKRASARSLVR